MKSLTKLAGAAALAATLGASASFAITTFDGNVTSNAIFGSGNGNGSWTIETANGVEVGLRSKVRFAGLYNSNGDGSYNHEAGISSGSAAKWNFEFSINVDPSSTSGLTLSDFHVNLSIDTDPTEGQNWVTFNPFAAWYDNSFGDSSTGQGAGVEAADFAGQTSLLGIWSLAQNSQNIGWTGLGFDVHADATYDFKLSATQVTGAPGAETQMRVIVGKGGAAVPDGGATFALAGLTLLGLCGLRRRLRK